MCERERESEKEKERERERRRGRAMKSDRGREMDRPQILFFPPLSPANFSTIKIQLIPDISPFLGPVL